VIHNPSASDEVFPSLHDHDAIGNVVATETTPSFGKLHYRPKAAEHTPPVGTVVTIKTRNARGHTALVVCRVADAHEVNPHQDAASATVREIIPIVASATLEGDSTTIYRKVALDPLEEIDLHNAKRVITAVETLPRAGNLVFRAPPELTAEVLGLEPDEDKSINLGSLRQSRDPFRLSRNAIQRHMLIVGAIGSGKSYTRGVIAEELGGLGVCQVNLDVNDELVDATEELGGINLTPGNNFYVPLSALTAQDVIEATPSLNGNMVDLVRHAHEELLKESRQQGRPFGIADLTQKIEQVAPDLAMDKRTTTPAKGRVGSLERLKYLGAPYDWAQQLTPGRLINIRCKGQLISDLRIIVAAVARDLQRLAVTNKIPFVVLSIDEFHLVAPKDDDTVALQVLREIARIGRHYRIGLILTTQSPADVDRSILKRLLTRFIHAIEPDQLDALRGVFSDASDDLIRQLPKLPQGTCLVTGVYETIRHATIVRVRARATTHGGTTPDVFSGLEATWGKKKTPAQVKETLRGPR
jgi:DNA helicase HerA-like ATPase